MIYKDVLSIVTHSVHNYTTVIFIDDKNMLIAKDLKLNFNTNSR